MVKKCSVPRCKGNYKSGPKVTVFRFPKEAELRNKWLLAIRREDFEPTQNSRVCELHFVKEDLQYVTEAYDEKRGCLISAKLPAPRLRKTAVPSQLDGCPSYLSKTVCYREEPNSKKERLENEQIAAAIAESLETNASYEKKHSFSSLSELLKALETSDISDFWKLVIEKQVIMFMNITIVPHPYINASVIIDNNLNVTAYLKNVQITKLGKFTLPAPCKNVNELHDILNLVHDLTLPTAQSSDSLVYDAIQSINETLSNLSITMSQHQKDVVYFVQEQLSLLMLKKNRLRYSSNFLILCTLMYSISPHSYRFLRNCGYLILPHPNTIGRLCSSYNVNPHLEQSNDNFLSYVKDKFIYLDDKDKKVVLLIDEIHLKPFLDFKGGDILGISYNTENAATTAYAFMVQSIFSNYKDVVHILPVQTISAEVLYEYLHKMIVSLESLGFTVICVSSDNNAINRRAMSMFCSPPKQNFLYEHPVDPSRPLFFVRDAVHLFKCIRNNWINQKNPNQCLYFPDFDIDGVSPQNDSLIVEDILDEDDRFLNDNNSSCGDPTFLPGDTFKTACFFSLKKIHDIEVNELVKHCHTLTQKALHPSSMDRQNVKLVVQIFKDHVVEGLLQAGPIYNLSHYSETADFLKIILTWWEIMNVKSSFKGDHKRNVFQRPLTSLDSDVKIKFLNSFLTWLERWKAMKCETGCLTSDTHIALYQTTYAMIEIARYCSDAFGVTYILTGKFQTDSLEARFGQYRQMAGAQYNISLTQVYETEKKLRIQSLIPLTLASNKCGQIVISSTDVDSTYTESDGDSGIELPLDLTLPISNLFRKFKFGVDVKDISNLKEFEPMLIYIAGYCCHSCVRRVKCNFCKHNLTLPDGQNVSPLQICITSMDRGGLKYPRKEVVDIIMYCYIVVSKLVSKEHEAEFLNCSNHREVVCLLTKSFLNASEKFLNFESCQNGHTSDMIQKYLIFSACNTFLKNYCKKLNDKLVMAQKKGKERKLNTLIASGVKDRKQKVGPLKSSNKKGNKAKPLNLSSNSSCSKNEKVLTDLPAKSKKKHVKCTNKRPRKKTNDTEIIDLSIKNKRKKSK